MKAILSILFIMISALLTMGFDSPEGVSVMHDSNLLPGFYIMVASGLVLVGVFDAVSNRDLKRKKIADRRHLR